MYTDSYYAPQAYRFTPAPEEQINQYINNYPTPKFLRRYTILGKPKPTILTLMSQIKDVITLEALNARTPEDLCEEEQLLSQDKRYKDDLFSLWNEASICFCLPSIMHTILTYIIYFAIFIPALIAIFYLLQVLQIKNFDFPPYVFKLPFLLFILLCALFITITAWLIRYNLPNYGVKYAHEFNRRTGLISSFKYIGILKNKKRLLHEIPFSQIDALIFNEPRAGYHLILQHQNSAHSVKLSDSFSTYFSEFDALTLWHFIQNYMDINQPLPDIPLFEKYRVKDPVTVQYDQEHLRNSRYWINMTEEEFIAKHALIGKTVMAALEKASRAYNL